MRTANPVLSESTLSKYAGIATEDTMTIQGAVNKTMILLALLVMSAAYVWSKFFTGDPIFTIFMYGGLFGGLIFALVTIFKKTWAPVTSPVYAVCEGMFLGGLSAVMEKQFPGIVIQAVALTLGVTATMLMAYKTGLIRATEKFKMGIVAATGGIFLIYMASMILGFFGVNIPFIHDSGPIGIGFSVFVVIIAALNLVLDFDLIEKGAENNMPKYFEWYSAFALMITLVWLYIEILRLLAKTRRR